MLIPLDELIVPQRFGYPPKRLCLDSVIQARPEQQQQFQRRVPHLFGGHHPTDIGCTTSPATEVVPSSSRRE